MTDINKQIEEESNYPSFQSIRDEGANRAVEMKSYVDRVIGREFFEFGAKWMLEKWKHSSRWRKVSEKLPELGVEVIITRNDGIRFLAWLDKDTELFFNVSGNEEYFLDEIQSWKPID